MAEWATPAELREYTTFEKVKMCDDGNMTRALKRARLNILSILRRDPGAPVSEKVQEALFIVAERMVLGRDEAVMAASSRGLSNVNYGEHSISFGQTGNPFITPEVLALLDEEIEKYPWQTLQTEKMVVPGQYGYTDDDDDVDYGSGAILYRNQSPYPYIP
jgi:hypothetical protein